MTLGERLVEYVRGGFSGLWLESHEHSEALTEIARICHQENWRVACWDVNQGLQVRGQSGANATEAGSDPLAAIRALSAMAAPSETVLLVLTNFHRFLGSAEIVQALARQIEEGKRNRTFVVVLSPQLQLPIELERLFTVLEHPLPSREELAQIARDMAPEEVEPAYEEALARAVDAAAGLTRLEAENAFALSLVRHEVIRPEAVWELKSQMLKKSGLVSLHRGGEHFDDLGGLDSLKSFCLRAMRRQGSMDPLRRPRGVMLLGVPGTGKSAIAKALGNETGRPTLCLDIGTLMGSLVGSTESNIRQVLRIADAMAPCVLFIDEIEKGLAGVASSGQTDSGVTARLFGTFLTWLNDHQSDVFVVATCNDIAKLPPEFTRAEWFDGVFFLDLPTAAQRKMIWDIYIGLFDLQPDQARPKDDNWTGAEIRACCRLSALLDLPLKAAAHNVVPVAVTAAESVERLRTWASGRCLDAEKGGIYSRDATDGNRRRRVKVDPSTN